MKTYICEICGDAYIGTDKPHDCPFCGAKANFIKEGKDANPIFLREEELSEETKKMMQETYRLEVDAVATYNCMAGKAKSYETKAMYKRLSKVELEHATIVTKFLGIDRPTIEEVTCADSEKENYEKTVALEDHAATLYAEFAKNSTEQRAKIFFTALTQVETAHIELIKNYL